MSEVERERTPITMLGFASALVVAWRALFGSSPTKAQAGVLWAQYGIETGAGPDAACWCWNIGNVKVTQGQVNGGIAWFDLPGTFEFIGGQRVELKEGDPGRRFRAYASLADGMTEHLRFLRNKRYAPAWPAVEAGDVAGFAERLHAAGYFTATAEAYAAGMRVHFDRWMRSPEVGDAFVEAELVDLEPSVVTVDQLEQEPAIIHPDVPLDPSGDA